MGTGCITFIDQSVCMVRLAARLAHFYHHESCGQCTPCREGTGWAYKVLNTIEAGQGRQEDLDLLLDMIENIEGNTICAHGDSLVIPVRSYIELFPEEFERHVARRAMLSWNHGAPTAPQRSRAPDEEGVYQRERREVAEALFGSKRASATSRLSCVGPCLKRA